MNTTLTLPGMETLVQPFTFPATPHEFKVMSLRECPTPETMQMVDCPAKAADYWRMHVATHPHFDSERECFVVLFLNTRSRVKGHQLVSIGILDQVLVHPREVFRAAIMTASHSIIVMHNHPGGESTPSDADLRLTRDLMRAGLLLKIELRDHVIVGNGNHTSLRELGHFHT